MKCKYCNEKEAIKYSKYSNGEFCSKECARGFSTKAKRKEINKKVSKTLSGRRSNRPKLPKFRTYHKHICEICEIEFKTVKRIQKTCGEKCKNEYISRKQKEKVLVECLNCGTLTGNPKYCSSKCDGEYKHNIVVEGYKKGIVKNVNHHRFRKWLIGERGAKCEKCDWSEMNEYSKTIPIVLNHIDGNSENYSLNNIELLCPNCDSLTPTYKKLNKGNGRVYRRNRYKEGKSY